MLQLRCKAVSCLIAAGLALFSTGCTQQETASPAVEETASHEPANVVIEIRRFDFMDVLSDGSAPQTSGAATEAGAGAATAIEAAVAEEAGEELEEEQGPEPPRRGTILFDLLVRYEGEGQAPPGVDVEFVHLDSVANEKGRYQEWVVTDGLVSGDEQQDVAEIEVENYEDGDAFSVLLREPVPAQDR